MNRIVVLNKHQKKCHKKEFESGGYKVIDNKPVPNRIDEIVEEFKKNKGGLLIDLEHNNGMDSEAWLTQTLKQFEKEVMAEGAEAAARSAPKIMKLERQDTLDGVVGVLEDWIREETEKESEFYGVGEGEVAYKGYVVTIGNQAITKIKEMYERDTQAKEAA